MVIFCLFIRVTLYFQNRSSIGCLSPSVEQQTYATIHILSQLLPSLPDYCLYDGVPAWFYCTRTQHRVSFSSDNVFGGGRDLVVTRATLQHNVSYGRLLAQMHPAVKLWCQYLQVCLRYRCDCVSAVSFLRYSYLPFPGKDDTTGVGCQPRHDYLLSIISLQSTRRVGYIVGDKGRFAASLILSVTRNDRPTSLDWNQWLGE